MPRYHCIYLSPCIKTDAVVFSSPKMAYHHGNTFFFFCPTDFCFVGHQNDLKICAPPCQTLAKLFFLSGIRGLLDDGWLALTFDLWPPSHVATLHVLASQGALSPCSFSSRIQTVKPAAELLLQRSGCCLGTGKRRGHISITGAILVSVRHTTLHLMIFIFSIRAPQL